MKFDITDTQLRRVVDGAVVDALKMHPDYLTERGQRLAKNGIAKRVTGALKGFAAQATAENELLRQDLKTVTLMYSNRVREEYDSFVAQAAEGRATG